MECILARLSVDYLVLFAAAAAAAAAVVFLVVAVVERVKA